MNFHEIQFLALILIAIFLYTAYPRFVAFRMRNNVRQCLYNQYNGPSEFIYYLNQLTAPNHEISSEEAGFFCEILKRYRADLTDYFFNSKTFLRRKVNLDGKEFFFYTLFSFLGEHACDRYLGENAMYTCISTTYYEGDGYLEECVLTDFGVVFYKAYFATAVYMDKKKFIYSNVLGCIEADLVTHQLKVSHYRP